MTRNQMLNVRRTLLWLSASLPVLPLVAIGCGSDDNCVQNRTCIPSVAGASGEAGSASDQGGEGGIDRPGAGGAGERSGGTGGTGTGTGGSAGEDGEAGGLGGDGGAAADPCGVNPCEHGSCAVDGDR